MTITEATIQALPDDELVLLIAQAQAEQALRERRRKEEAIVKIRALAGEAGLSVTIGGARGRPGGKALKKRGETEHPALKPPLAAGVGHG